MISTFFQCPDYSNIPLPHENTLTQGVRGAKSASPPPIAIIQWFSKGSYFEYAKKGVLFCFFKLHAVSMGMKIQQNAWLSDTDGLLNTPIARTLPTYII